MKISTFLFWKNTVLQAICATSFVATTPGQHRLPLHGSLDERLMSGPSGADFISHPALHLLICIHRRLIIFNCDRFRIRIKFYSSHLKFSSHPDIEAWFSDGGCLGGKHSLIYREVSLSLQDGWGYRPVTGVVVVST